MADANNLFLKAVGANDTLTENGAVSNSSCGMAILDQFGKSGNYMGREYSEIAAEQEALWKENPDYALRFPFYLRLITRKTLIDKDHITEKNQMGQGLKDEAFKRLLWIAQNHPQTFNENIHLLPIVGSWKDIWMMMYYDTNLKLNVINHKVMFNLMKEGIQHAEHVELIRKFFPRVKSSSKLNTPWRSISNNLAKEFCEFMGWTLKESNKFKACGKAHEFQKLICNRDYDKLKWGMIPGRALNLLANSKFMFNHHLTDSYMEWLRKQPVAKFTGYVHELGKQCLDKLRFGMKVPPHQLMTIDKQFDGLVKKASEDGTITENVWCALDTSGSMWQNIPNTKKDLKAIDVCLSLGVFFATLNKGAFHKNVIMFDNISRIKQLEGDFSDMLKQLPRNAMGGTNFQSVVDEIVRVRRTMPNIPLEEYPTTLLVVSDMQFNPTNSYSFYKTEFTREEEESNYQAMKRKLYEVFPQEFVDSMKFIWWHVTATHKDFPTRMEDGGCYNISGYDGSIVSLILKQDENKSATEKKPKSMLEMVHDALSQEIFEYCKVVD